MLSSCSIPRVLVADDQPDVLAALEMLLRSSGFDPEPAGSVQAVRDRLTERRYDLLLMDLNYARDTTSGHEGLELLDEVRRLDGTLPVIVMTGWGTIETAVEAMRRGARSFVNKPWDNRLLAEAVRREVATGAAARQVHDAAEREREQARSIQRALLPGALPRVAGCELATVWRPASDFGGDCYDVRARNEHELTLTIADVAGKGLPAALLMAHLQAAVRAYADAAVSAVRLTVDVNRSLVEANAHGRFVTFFYAAIDLRDRTLRYCNGGHDAPILMRADGSVQRLAAGGVPIGLFSDAAYEEGAAELRPGDRLLCFTDGIREAEDRDGGEFGDGRVVDLLRRLRNAPAQHVVSELMNAVNEHAGGRLADDATVLCLALTDS